MTNPSIISHVSVGTNDYKKAKEFYTEVLTAVGYRMVEDLEEYKAVGFGKEFPEFWVGEPEEGEATPGNGVHVSFIADSTELVDKFYEKAMELRAKDNGAPGLREAYGPGYYAAYIFDLDGNKIEMMNWNPNA